MNKFIIDSRLTTGNSTIQELSLSTLLLSGNALFPWVILVPRRDDVREIIDLSEAERITLMEEISLMSHVMQEVFKPEKLNIAAFGNIVPQLHVHIIARYSNDVAWPDPVFGKGKETYEEAQRDGWIQALCEAIRRLG